MAAAAAAEAAAEVEVSVKYLVVGGGISGLAFANFLPAGSDYLVVEREAECGGWSRTIRQDGFVWDYSGHFFHFRDPHVREFMEAGMKSQGADGEVLRVEKRTGIVWGQGDDTCRIDFPFQKNIHQLPKEDFIDCLYGLYFRDEDARGDAVAGTFEGMLYEKFGRGITEKFLKPYNEKLYACPLTNLDQAAMGRFFPHVDLADIIRNMRRPDNASYNQFFTYPRGGAQTYVGALLSTLDPARVSLREEVRAIDLEARVATTGRRRIRYEHLVTSLPFHLTLGMAGVPYEAGTYTYNKVLVWNLGFDLPSACEDHWLYVPDRDLCFYRVGFYSNIFGDARMSLYVEVGYASGAEVDAEATLPRVLDDLRKIGIVRDHKLVSSASVMLDPAYVHINTRSRADFAEKHAALRERDVHSIGRYGGWKYCAIEDNVIEAYALVHELTGATESSPFRESGKRYFEISDMKNMPRLAGLGPVKLPADGGGAQ